MKKINLEQETKKTSTFRLLLWQSTGRSFDVLLTGMNQADNYYGSHSKLSFIGTAGQSALTAARVLVIGAGGLGCPCLQALASAGIGTIGVADFDTISISNLHRQTLYQFADVGQLKTAVAAEQLLRSNPFIQVQKHELEVNAGNVLELIHGYDIIVDGTDNFTTRYCINDACVLLNKPLVYGAIHQTEGHVTVFNYKNSGTLRCLFPQENPAAVQSCAVIGAYQIVTNIIGTLMANEVIKVILKHADVLADQLLQVDVLAGNMLKIKYHLIEANIARSKAALQLASTVHSISVADLHQQLKANLPLQLIDVRTIEERNEFHIEGFHIPLQELLNLHQLSFDKTAGIVLYCQSGQRSQVAAEWLCKQGYQQVFTLKGGLNAWRESSPDS